MARFGCLSPAFRRRLRAFVGVVDSPDVTVTRPHLPVLFVREQRCSRACPTDRRTGSAPCLRCVEGSARTCRRPWSSRSPTRYRRCRVSEPACHRTEASEDDLARHLEHVAEDRSRVGAHAVRLLLSLGVGGSRRSRGAAAHRAGNEERTPRKYDAENHDSAHRHPIRFMPSPSSCARSIAQRASGAARKFVARTAEAANLEAESVLDAGRAGPTPTWTSRASFL